MKDKIHCKKYYIFERVRQNGSRGVQGTGFKLWDELSHEDERYSILI